MKKKAQKATVKSAAKKTLTKKTKVTVRSSAVQKAASSSKGSAVKAKKSAASASEAVKVKAAKKLPAKTLADFRELLMVIRARLTGQVASLKGDSLLRHDAVNTEEDGTDAFERQFALSLASSETDSLLEIEEALARIEDATYGSCEHCGSSIEIPRLKALPFARNCVRCQSEMEKNGQHLNSAATRRAL